jgi:hypothetical protein
MNPKRWSRQIELFGGYACSGKKLLLRSARSSFLPKGQDRVDFCCTSSWEPTAERSSQRNQADFHPEAARVSGLESWEHPTQNPHQSQRDCEPGSQPKGRSDKFLTKD